MISFVFFSWILIVSHRFWLMNYRMTRINFVSFVQRASRRPDTREVQSRVCRVPYILSQTDCIHGVMIPGILCSFRIVFVFEVVVPHLVSWATRSRFLQSPFCYLSFDLLGPLCLLLTPARVVYFCKPKKWTLSFLMKQFHNGRKPLYLCSWITTMSSGHDVNKYHLVTLGLQPMFCTWLWWKIQVLPSLLYRFATKRSFVPPKQWWSRRKFDFRRLLYTVRKSIFFWNSHLMSSFFRQSLSR